MAQVTIYRCDFCFRDAIGKVERRRYGWAARLFGARKVIYYCGHHLGRAVEQLRRHGR